MKRIASFVPTIGLAIVETGLLFTAGGLLRGTFFVRASSLSPAEEVPTSGSQIEVALQQPE